MTNERKWNGTSRSVERTGNGKFFWRTPYLLKKDLCLLEDVLQLNEVQQVPLESLLISIDLLHLALQHLKLGLVWGGEGGKREGGREGRVGGREGRVGAKDGGRDKGRREGGREGGREGRMEGETKEGGRDEGRREGGRKEGKGKDSW